ncbi:MAG TPA: hypothetical protein VN786_08980 [Acidimicrobiales bacterium]|nr:hypothetical protein [Acidimicrobiales bacterium]
MSKHLAVPEAGLVMPQRPQLVRWGGVFSGTVIGVAMFALLDALWLALSFGSHDSVVYSNLSWWIAGTAIFCIFIAGLIAGLSSSARGLSAGSVSGLTTWGLVVIAVGVVVIPTFAIGHIPNTVTVSGTVYSINYLSYWAAFWSLLIGLGAGLLGGMIGGAMPRSIDEPYLDLRETALYEPVASRTAVAPSAMAPGTTAVPAGVPMTASNRMVPVGTTSPPSEEATGPYFYEHQ